MKERNNHERDKCGKSDLLDSEKFTEEVETVQMLLRDM